MQAAPSLGRADDDGLRPVFGNGGGLKWHWRLGPAPLGRWPCEQPREVSRTVPEAQHQICLAFRTLTMFVSRDAHVDFLSILP